MSKWTFLTNYLAVLLVLAKEKQITARKISQEIGITERCVQKIISDLEQAEYLTKIKQGKKIEYILNKNMPLRRPKYRDIAVGTLLKLLE